MDGIDPIAVLTKFALEKKKRIQHCANYDSNVSSSICNGTTGWHPQLKSCYAFTHEIRMSLRGRRVHIVASPEYIRLQMDGRLEAEPCSINRPNRISFVDLPSALKVSGDPRWPVFVSRQGAQGDALPRLLSLTDFHSVIAALIEYPTDSVHLFEDSICAYFHPKSTVSLQAAIDSLIKIVGKRRNPKDDYLDSLPGQFASLRPFINSWAEGDDGWRAEKLSCARRSQIELLVATVEPLLSQIDEYLSNNDDAAAHAIGRIAEFVAEARIHLRRIGE